MKIYCTHSWNIEFVCASGIEGKCRRCNSVFAGSKEDLTAGQSNPDFLKTEIAHTEPD